MKTTPHRTIRIQTTDGRVIAARPLSAILRPSTRALLAALRRQQAARKENHRA